MAMPHRTFRRALTFILGALAAGSLLLFGARYNKVVQIGMPAPGFENLPATDGKNYSISDFKEDVLVVVFLANHCPWVRGNDPDLIKLVNDYKGKSVHVVAIGVNLQRDDILPAMKERAAKSGYNFVYLHDATQQTGRRYGATHTPEYFVLNKERKIVYTGLLTNSPALAEYDGSLHYTRGTPKQFYVRDAIDAALAGKAVTVAETAPQGCTVEYER
jgi:cytochrome oxidase Cu insertion factor (SCO1/SenC/PrrC family)